jgi:hypothetical protein
MNGSPSIFGRSPAKALRRKGMKKRNSELSVFAEVISEVEFA